MKILAIDPGSTKSGFVVFCNTTNKIISYGKVDNCEILKMALPDEKSGFFSQDITLIEKPDFLSYGAGDTVIEAIFWAGRFRQAFKGSITFGRNFLKKSYEVKNDAEVIKFIRTNYPGIKLKADSWQAFLLIHAYETNLVSTEKRFKKKKQKKQKVVKVVTDLFD